MYSGRRDRGPGNGGGGANFLESRRAQREARTVNIWPPSPKAPAKELSPKRKKPSKRTKRRRSPSVSAESDVEAIIPPPARSPLPRQPSSGPAPSLSDNQDSDDETGPQPMQKVGSKKIDERSYGGALLRGEGSAMAAFLQDGIESRIPRRGEIGLTSDQIAQYEDVGYVMSGSRHRRMNAVRMRKENQVISAEEKRGILKLQRDERERREAILREEFSELVSERLKGSASEPRAK